MRRFLCLFTVIAPTLVITGVRAQVTTPEPVDAPDHGAVIDKTKPGDPPASAVSPKPPTPKRPTAAASGAASGASQPAVGTPR